LPDKGDQAASPVEYSQRRRKCMDEKKASA
ncbi:hypothetical protein A2U01_0016696, partial [Trifolium medium]|nr:hypothetical protein [Trifolium medium]